MGGSENHVEIIVPIVCGFTFFFFLVMYFIWKARFGKKPDVLPQHGAMDGIIPSDGRRKRSGTLSPHMLADIERAQRFRERARTVIAGRPKFKASRKRGGSFKSEPTFHTLENHQFGDKITFRRISEDRTSSFSAYSITDIESRGGVADGSAGGALLSKDSSFNSFNPRRDSVGQVEESALEEFQEEEI